MHFVHEDQLPSLAASPPIATAWPSGVADRGRDEPATSDGRQPPPRSIGTAPASTRGHAEYLNGGSLGQGISPFRVTWDDCSSARVNTSEGKPQRSTSISQRNLTLHIGLMVEPKYN